MAILSANKENRSTESKGWLVGWSLIAVSAQKKLHRALQKVKFVKYLYLI